MAVVFTNNVRYFTSIFSPTPLTLTAMGGRMKGGHRNSRPWSSAMPDAAG